MSLWKKAAREPTEAEEKKLLGLAVKVALENVMDNHTTKFDGKILAEGTGGVIGEDMTRSVASCYMINYDRKLKEKIDKIKTNSDPEVIGEWDMRLEVLGRYVDDMFLVTTTLKPGVRLVGEKLVLVESEIENDRSRAGDVRTMDIVREIGNQLDPCIRLTSEVPGQTADGKMALLDMKVWLEEEVRGEGHKNRIMWEYFEKEMTTRQMIRESSAIALQQKRTIFTQEVIRRMKNCCPELEVERRNDFLSDLMQKMKNSGYGEKFRLEVLKSGMKAYDIMVQNDAEGTTPMYRSREWKERERREKKQGQMTGWFKTVYKNSKEGKYESVVFVPTTINSELANRIKEVIKEVRIPIKVAERPGRKYKDLLVKSDPLTDGKCGRPDCVVCQEEKGKNCEKDSVGYRMSCITCKDNGVRSWYEGESSRNLYTRSKEHVGEFKGGKESSVMRKHNKEVHGGVEARYEFKVLSSYKEDTMMRQVNESNRIERNRWEDIIVMNSKDEFNQARMPKVRFEM